MSINGKTVIILVLDDDRFIVKRSKLPLEARFGSQIESKHKTTVLSSDSKRLFCRYSYLKSVKMSNGFWKRWATS